MQRYTIFFITVKALRVSGGFYAHHQELKNCIHRILYVPGLLAPTAASCWLYLKEYINDARARERQISCSGRLNSHVKICTFHYVSFMVVVDARDCVLNFKEMIVI
jgi:hypothetical protein